jgi:hypothetical protein
VHLMRIAITTITGKNNKIPKTEPIISNNLFIKI